MSTFADFIQLLLHSFPIKNKNSDLIYRKESRDPNKQHLSTSSLKVSNLPSIFLCNISPLELTLIYIAHCIDSQEITLVQEQNTASVKKSVNQFLKNSSSSHKESK